MRPIRLSIRGVRSFRTEPETVIDFEGRDQLAIIGDTGAGKSSILEAMTYALYGQVSFTAHAAQELMNDESEQLRVELRFRIGTDKWVATRELQRKASGEVGGQTASLEQIDDNGMSVELCEGVNIVNKRAALLLGLDVHAFLRTIVLPQGRFARLLAEDDPRARASILRQIWQTAELERASEAVTEAQGNLKLLNLQVETGLRDQPDDVEEDLREHQERVEKARQAAGAANTKQVAVNGHLDKIETLEDRERKAADAQETCQSVPTAMLAGTAARIENTDRALGHKEEEAQTAESEAADALNKLDSGSQVEIDLADKTRKTLRRAQDDNAAVAEAVHRTLKAQDQTKQTEVARDHAKTALSDASANETKSAKRRRQTAAGVEDARTNREKAQAPWSAYQTARQAVTRSQERIAQREAKVRQSKADLAQAEATAKTAQAELESATGRLAERRTAASAAAAAHDCEPGDPCPVCGKTLNKTWEQPPGNGLSAAEEEVETKAATARQAWSRRAAAHSRCESAQTEFENERSDEARAEANRAQTAKDCAQALGTEPEEVARTGAARLAELSDEVTDATRQAERAAEALEGATRARSTSEVQHARAETAWSAKDAELQNALEAQRQAEGQAKLAVDHAKETGQWDGRSADGLSNALVAADRRWEAARAAMAQRLALGETMHKAGQRRLELAAERQREVTQPTEALRHEVDNAENEMRRHLAVIGIEAGNSPPGAETTPTALMHWLENEKEQAIKATAQTLEATQEACRAEKDALSKTLEGDSWTEGLSNTRGLREHMGGQARYFAANLALANAAENRARKAAPATLGLRQTGASAANLQGQLADLARGLKPGGFAKWLTLRRSTDLLRHASVRLEEMTNGRYGFRDPRDTEEQWKVLDRLSGGSRTPSSLSGGEQFIAALALALGMVETMGQRGGKIEAFFLDEGFGTLDRKTLDDALDALDDAASPDHLVGVITHVREVAERIPHVLGVSYEPGTGSRATWLTDKERTGNGQSVSGPAGGLTRAR